ncbi:MAG: energy transducer TonB [Candidatus Aminicenantes bacterium]|nr:energy transducer TonB [Candidatus Aminicenantes bacterium]
MKKTASMIAIIVLALALPARAEMTLNIKLDFFGPLAAENVKSNVTTSFYLKSMVQRNLQVTFSSEALQAELQKTFNAPKVSLLAAGDLVWKSGGEPSVMQIVQIDGRDYALILTPLPKPGAVNFKVGVVEENNQKNIKNILLDTEIVLPDREVAVLGFRDAQENSYFIAFYVQGRDDKISKDVLQLLASQKPRKIKEIKPVYPQNALMNRIQSVVTLNVETDANGQVQLAEVISGHPLFNDAAIRAVRQWVYEPYIVNGVAKAVAFTVTVTFKLNDDAEAKNDNNALTRLRSSQRPRLIKKVLPVYPTAALEKKIEGIVILEATINEKGIVTDARLIKSPDPLLTDAALNAVKQWVYEPYIMDGKAEPLIFTVTVTFGLNDEPEAKKNNNALVHLQDGQRLRLIKKVKPAYPIMALKKRIEGTVVLEATIDEKGMVTDARMITATDTHLVSAAIAAVKQWVYEPYVENGKAKPAAFTVTVTFALNKK